MIEMNDKQKMIMYFSIAFLIGSTMIVPLIDKTIKNKDKKK